MSTRGGGAQKHSEKHGSTVGERERGTRKACLPLQGSQAGRDQLQCLCVALGTTLRGCMGEVSPQPACTSTTHTGKESRAWELLQEKGEKEAEIEDREQVKREQASETEAREVARE